MKETHKYNRFKFRVGLLALLVFYTVLSHSVGFPKGTKAQVEQEQRDLKVRVKKPEQKVALVIGNAEYDTSIGKLKNPVNDATDIAAALQRLGFKLVGGKPQMNLDKRQMLELIREFGNQIGKGGVGVFYFAGHGVQIDKRNYLIPITDSLQYQEDAEFAAVDVDQILRQIENAGNALNIMILDACRNNGLLKKPRSAEKGLGEPQSKPSGVFIAFAARDGQVALDNPNSRNGLYTQELLKNLETPNLRIEDIFINTRREVKRLSRLSGQVQEPIEYGSLDYVFYFKPGATVSAQSPPGPLPNANVHAPSLTSETTSAQPPPDFLPSTTILIPFLKGGKFGFSDTSRKLVIEAKYDDVFPFDKEGLARVKLNNKYGYIDKTGKVVIPLDYDNADSFNEGLALVKLNNKFSYIDKTGRVVMLLDYDYADSFSEGLARVKRHGNWGYIDKTGKVVIPLKYKEAISFSEGLASVTLDYNYGYIDKTGKEVISPVYYLISDSFSDGLARVQRDYKYGYIDKTGKEVIEAQYGGAISFSDGLARVEKDGKYGYIDKTGKVVIWPQYDDASPFSDGLASVKERDKYGCIDKTGKAVTQFKYDAASSFSDGLARVKLSNREFYIDKNGAEYYEP